MADGFSFFSLDFFFFENGKTACFLIFVLFISERKSICRQVDGLIMQVEHVHRSFSEFPAFLKDYVDTAGLTSFISLTAQTVSCISAFENIFTESPCNQKETTKKLVALDPIIF